MQDKLTKKLNTKNIKFSCLNFKKDDLRLNKQ